MNAAMNDRMKTTSTTSVIKSMLIGFNMAFWVSIVHHDDDDKKLCVWPRGRTREAAVVIRWEKAGAVLLLFNFLHSRSSLSLIAVLYELSRPPTMINPHFGNTLIFHAT